MNKILLQTISAPGCKICKEFEEFWHSVEKDFPNVEYQNLDITTPQGQQLAQEHMILASPGIIINGEIFSSGGFDREKFIKKLKELNNE